MLWESIEQSVELVRMWDSRVVEILSMVYTL